LSGGARALAVSNGTTAIHLAYLAIGIQAGDEIVAPGFGFLAAANVALHMAARPVFCEVDPRTWCMRAEDIAPVLTARTRAIVVVHTYGNVCDMAPILALANERSIPVIEDAAEAFPSRYRGQLAGTLGTIGTFSFQATKTITTGEGGMVVTRDDALCERMMLYRSHGLRRKKHYWHEVPGLNCRLTNMQAALGCAQMEKLDRIIAERLRVYATYSSRLARMPGVTLQIFRPEVEPVVWAIAVQLDPAAFPQGRDAVLQQMLEAGIETRPGFYSPGQLEYFDCPPLATCDALAASVISLPSYPTLTEPEIERICAQLAKLGRS
jgi:perosamine synthetase